MRIICRNSFQIPDCAASRSSSSSNIRLIPPDSSRNFLCSSSMSPKAKKLWDTTDAKKRSACASSPKIIDHIFMFFQKRDYCKTDKTQGKPFSHYRCIPWVEIEALLPLCSIAYNKLNPHVTLWGSCFVVKSSSTPNIHFFFKSKAEWLRSSINLVSTIWEE